MNQLSTQCSNQLSLPAKPNDSLPVSPADFHPVSSQTIRTMRSLVQLRAPRAYLSLVQSCQAWLLGVVGSGMG